MTYGLGLDFLLKELCEALCVEELVVVPAPNATAPPEKESDQDNGILSTWISKNHHMHQRITVTAKNCWARTNT